MNKIDGFPKCHVINLIESKDRREYMKSEFEKLGIHDAKIFSYQRYNSDGYHPFKVVNSENLRQEFVGAVTSHLLTIKWWYENTNEDIGMFFEDDCDFSIVENFNFSFSDYLEKFGPLWDCLQLCIIHEMFPIMLPRHRNAWDHGLQAYIIKRHYAKKLIEYYFRDDNTIHLRMPYDNREKKSIRMPTSIENMIYGLGQVYVHPIINHNVKFDSVAHDVNNTKHMDVAKKSYEYIKQWWETVGHNSTLDQLFDYNHCCPLEEFEYYGLMQIDI